jgi:hypothetical protein
MAKTKLCWGILVCCIGLYTSCAGVPEALVVPPGEYQEVPEGYHKVMFLAYGRGTFVDNEKSIAGHASIAIEGSGAWGFYPTTGQRLFTRRGVLRHSAGYPITQEYVEFTVADGIVDKLRELIAKWENDPPPFIIPVMDCVTFVYRACDIIGLRYNHFSVVPISAVRKIGRLNDRSRLYASPPKGIE